MDKIKLSILLLTLSFYSFGQVELSEEEYELMANKAITEIALQQENNPSVNASFLPSTISSVVTTDMDDDGMDDDWELANGLDPNEPKDAWADADDDQILNLFEFQLDTDPNDASVPTVVDIRPTSGATLDDLVDQAENTIRVFRLTQGDYEANAVSVFTQNFSLMIQGGWNDDFTEYNPDLYPTNWFGGDDEALRIIVPEDNSMRNATVILEGVNFQSTDNFGLGGPVSISTRSDEAAISIYDCSFNSNNFYGLGLFHSGENNDRAEVFIVNTIFGNNTTGGINTQVVDGTIIRWRLINTTINNPESQRGGIRGLTADQATLKIELTNSINWGNTNSSFNFASFHNVEITTINSNIDQAEPGLTITDLANSINEDPLFEAVNSDDWTLTEGSPCIDAGIDIGLPFKGAAPDMGALERAEVSNTSERYTNDQLQVFPNPFSESISIAIDEENWMNAEIKIYDVLGKCWFAEKRAIVGQLEIETGDLPEGMFILNVKSQEQAYSTKLLKR